MLGEFSAQIFSSSFARQGSLLAQFTCFVSPKNGSRQVEISLLANIAFKALRFLIKQARTSENGRLAQTSTNRLRTKVFHTFCHQCQHKLAPVLFKLVPLAWLLEFHAPQDQKSANQL